VAIRDLADLTWEEVRDLDRARTVAILPVGAVEAHGPHLPLAADVVIARAMARAGGERLESLGFGALILPPVSYTAASYAAEFAGTISIGGGTVTALLLDLARELTRHGFGALALANAHLDPAHLEALAEAERRAREGRLLPVICPDISKKPWALRLTPEFQSGACHAGRYESSIVLAERPDLVREEIRKELPPNSASISKAIRSGAKSFVEADGKRAYFGWPADATAEEGRTSIDALGAILAEAVTAAFHPGKRA
jgi:creatinine amidohydrolase